MLQLHDPQPDLLDSEKALSEDRVCTQVWELLGTLYPQYDMLERRQENRYPFPQLIHLTPIAEDGITPEGKSVVVVGRHLSRSGLGFYHPKPLSYRRMIASLECHGHWLGFIIDIRWCRFTQQGWYESGGRFIKAVPSPITSTE